MTRGTCSRNRLSPLVRPFCRPTAFPSVFVIKGDRNIEDEAPIRYDGTMTFMSLDFFLIDHAAPKPKKKASGDTGAGSTKPKAKPKAKSKGPSKPKTKAKAKPKAKGQPKKRVPQPQEKIRIKGTDLTKV